MIPEFGKTRLRGMHNLQRGMREYMQREAQNISPLPDKSLFTPTFEVDETGQIDVSFRTSPIEPVDFLSQAQLFVDGIAEPLQSPVLFAETGLHVIDTDNVRHHFPQERFEDTPESKDIEAVEAGFTYPSLRFTWKDQENHDQITVSSGTKLPDLAKFVSSFVPGLDAEEFRKNYDGSLEAARAAIEGSL